MQANNLNNTQGTMARNEAINSRNDLSFCIVWSPLPLITWLFPVIGHVGIANSQGIASDFRGHYYVGDDGRMIFGAPTRALKVSVEDIGAERWDEAIREANQIYCGRRHNLLCDNCHSHVACALNRMPLKAYGITKWNMAKLALLIFVKGRFLSVSAVFLQFGPFLVLILIIVLSTTLKK